MRYDNVNCTEKWELRHPGDATDITRFLEARGSKVTMDRRGRRFYLLVTGTVGELREARREARKRWILRLAGVSH